jgi:hypothetical protein
MEDAMREVPGIKPFAAVWFVVLFGTVSAYSQATASLRGTITDPSGAVILDAAVTIESSDNGTIRKSTTDTQGEYSFLQVAPGNYKLAAEKPGFATMTKGDVQLLVNTPATLDLKMSLSTTGEVVNVQSETSQSTLPMPVWETPSAKRRSANCRCRPETLSSY